MSADAKHPTDALLSLVYGELEEAEAARVEAHVKGCAECALRLDEYRAVRKAAAALPREMASDKGLASLLHYGAQAAARTRKRRSTRLTASLLAGLVAAALVWVVWPQRPKESTWASAPEGPAAVGPLAQNDVPAVAKPEPQGLPEASATLRKAPSLTPPRPSAAKAAARPTETDKAKRKEEATASEASDALASRDAAPGAVARLQAPPAANQRAALAGARGTSGAGVSGANVSASRNAPASSPSAPSAAAAPSSVALKAAPLDAGPQAQLDAERRRTLLQQLEGASGPTALPLLSELCALDAKLLYRDEARATCARVVQGYPGTQEAAAAQRVLDTLNAR
jgi:Putative zinc-finger